MTQTGLNDIFYNLWFLLPLVSFLSMPLFICVLWYFGKRGAAGFLLFMAVESVFAALYTVHTFGGTFGPGMMIFWLSFVVFLVSLMLLVFIHSLFYRRFTEDETRRNFYIRGGLLIILMHFAPVIGYFSIRVACSLQTRHNALPYISAVNDLYQVTGIYPLSLDDFKNAYSGAAPAPGCAWLEEDDSNQFEIMQCSTGETLLTADTVDGSSILRYNFESGGWSSISFLDGACSLLR